MRKLLSGAVLGIAFLVGCSALTGCSGLSGISKNIKDDQAIVVVKVMTPWGPQHMTRIGGTTNSVTVGPDGKVTINPTK